MKIGSAVERALSLSAGVVAIAAVVITLYEARIEREHQKVSVWPYINQGNLGGNGQYNRTVRNVGLGPALVRSFQATLDGKPVATWGDVRRGLLGLPDHRRLRRNRRDNVLEPWTRYGAYPWRQPQCVHNIGQQPRAAVLGVCTGKPAAHARLLLLSLR